PYIAPFSWHVYRQNNFHPLHIYLKAHQTDRSILYYACKSLDRRRPTRYLSHYKHRQAPRELLGSWSTRLLVCLDCWQSMLQLLLVSCLDSTCCCYTYTTI